MHPQATARALEQPFRAPEAWEDLRACPICASPHLAHFRTGAEHGFSVHHDRCRRCLLVFQNPRPTQAWYDRFFQSHYWEQKALDRGGDVRRHTVQWRTQLIRSQRYLACLAAAGVSLPPQARLLEVGCAYGMIVRDLADAIGATPFGVEPSDAAASSARDLAKITILGRGIGDIADSAGPFDLILFSHVLEYIVDLDAVFERIRRLSKPGGILVIGTPNIFFRHAARLEHPYCFCKRSLHRLFARHGIEPLRIEPVSRFATAFTPDFSLTAVGIVGTPAALTPQASPLPGAGLTMRVGAAWFSVANRFPVNRLLGGINKAGTQLGQSGKSRLAELTGPLPPPA